MESCWYAILSTITLSVQAALRPDPPRDQLAASAGLLSMLPLVAQAC